MAVSKFISRRSGSPHYMFIVEGSRGPGHGTETATTHTDRPSGPQLSGLLEARRLAQKLERLRGCLHFLDDPAPAQCRHTFFVDSPEEAAQLDPAQQLGTTQVGAGGPAVVLCWGACLQCLQADVVLEWRQIR